MNTSSPSPTEIARKSQAAILRALRSPGRQVAIATAMGVSEAKVSRLKTEHLQDICQMLAYAGLRVVPTDEVTIDRDTLHAFAVMTRAALGSADDIIRAIESPQQEP